ncbi:ABC transporter permease [Amylibacter ulvae]|uniref:ABC transporter permease n=1 Tax=Paramylibacter ulvae TaxID=1651968 RepID=A0ABQ3D1J2_9RHOB|nr:ABC transporter permease [Amylibacter ulvae]GHA52285.1 ABC transporter permease [Amylibacter ulvae]
MDVISKSIQLIFSGDHDLFQIVLLSLRVSFTATFIASCLAIPFGAMLTNYDFTGKRAIMVVASAFMALPPVVVGLLVYLMLSRSGPLGEWGLLYTPSAMIIAQTMLIFPIVLVLTVEALKPIKRDYSHLMNALDVPPMLRLRTMIWDARFAIYTAVLAGFGRALAEVGAVILVGGNINGQTRVMTTTIALESSKGNLELALALGLILILLALIINAAMHGVARIGQRYQVTRQ